MKLLVVENYFIAIFFLYSGKSSNRVFRATSGLLIDHINHSSKVRYNFLNIKTIHTWFFRVVVPVHMRIVGYTIHVYLNGALIAMSLYPHGHQWEYIIYIVNKYERVIWSMLSSCAIVHDFYSPDYCDSHNSLNSPTLSAKPSRRGADTVGLTRLGIAPGMCQYPGGRYNRSANGTARQSHNTPSLSQKSATGSEIAWDALEN